LNDPESLKLAPPEPPLPNRFFGDLPPLNFFIFPNDDLCSGSDISSIMNFFLNAMIYTILIRKNGARKQRIACERQ
jgi:hypothetical protein